MHIDRIGLGTIDLNLRHHGKSHAIVGAAEFEDLGILPRFLPTELVARECEDRQSPGTVPIVQFLKLLVLRSKSASTRDVDHQYNSTSQRLDR